MKTKQENMMGATISISIDHPQAESLLDDVFTKYKAFEKDFSANDPTSQLSRVNQTACIEPVEVSERLFNLIEIGLNHSLAPESYLNIAIGPLVKLWRIGFSDAQVPTDQEIKEIMPLIDPANITLDSARKTVFFKHENMAIDLGALAKGYLADLTRDYLVDQGVNSALIDLGGNIVTYGINPNRDTGLWNIGIQNPEKPRGNPVLVIRNQGGSVVTSGDYVRNLTKNGRTYHHIFDSKTGYPIETDVNSLTIISNQSIDGEIWTTRLYGHPILKIMEIVEQTDGIEAIVLTKNHDIYASDGAREMIM